MITKTFMTSALILTSLILILSCNKDEELLKNNEQEIIEKLSLQETIETRKYRNEIIEDFFKHRYTSTNRDGDIDVLIANQILFEMDSEFPFLEDLINEYGQALWDDAVFIDPSDDIFEISVPVKKNGEITSAFLFYENDEGAAGVFFSRKEFHDKVIKYEKAATTIVEEFLYDEFSSSIKNEEDDQRVSCNCSGLSVPTYFQLNGTTANFSLNGYGNQTSHCTCFDWTPGSSWTGGTIAHSCCENYTGGLLDDGQFEAGSLIVSASDFGSWDAWINWYTQFLNADDDDDDQVGGGGGTRTNNPPNSTNTNFNDDTFFSDGIVKIATSVIDFTDCFPEGEMPNFDDFLEYINENTSFPVNTSISANGNQFTIENLMGATIGNLSNAAKNLSASEFEEFLDLLESIDCSTLNNTNNTNDEECSMALDDFISNYSLELEKTHLLMLNHAISAIDCSNQEEFENVAISTLLQDCLDPYYQLFDHLGIYSNQEKLDFCFSEFPILDPPNCEGCSVEQAQILWADQIKALEMLECAIDKLNEFDGTNPEDVKDALFTHFGGTSSTIVAGYIAFKLNSTRRFPYERSYFAKDDCDPGVLASTTLLVQFANVNLCDPLFWEQPESERTNTLIHEWMHLHNLITDVRYNWEDEYNDLNTIQQLFNADAYSEFVEEICYE